MRKRYFFFDYDGTLAVKHTYTIPEDTRDALTKLEEAGHFVALATGRLQCNAVDYISSVGMKNLVADGGYSVTIDGELVWMKPLDLEPVKDCFRKLDELNIPWAVTVENELLRYTNNQRFIDMAGDYYLPTILDEDMRIDGLTQVYKGYVYCEREKEAEFLATGAMDGVPWVRYASDVIFIEPLVKEVGIKKVMDHFGAPYADAVVFGDGANDLSMFSDEWTSIAMGNAIDALKAKATFVTTDVDKGGIANACRHFGWIE